MNRMITLLLLIFTLNVNASVTASGFFEANESCSAFLSKNKKNHPFTIQPHQLYPIKEFNQLPATWVRIVVSEDNGALRWVNANCGNIKALPRTRFASCDSTVGMADSYVLALSSQPGFCQTYGYEAGKPECLMLTKTSYEATHLTLHGLWPNQEACGQRYGFCGVKPLPNHCDYPELALSSVVKDELSTLMPSYHYGSCLERHEWYKHGSCQSLSVDEYFNLALHLAKEVNHSSFGLFLTQNGGRVVKLADIRQSIENAFGKGNRGKVHLGCKNGILVDVLIELPATIAPMDSLSSLMDQAPNFRYRDSCPARVKLSNFSKNSSHFF